jgi:hypothetical protein
MEQIQYNTGLTGPDSPQDQPQDEEVSVDSSESSETPQEDPQETPQDSQQAFGKFHEEWASSGKLSESSYDELKQMGIPREYVDQYIKGIAVLQEQGTAAVYSSVGGEEKYNQMTAWAADNFSEDEIEAYNKAIESDPQSQKFALNSLKARFEAASGNSEPKFMSSAAKASKQGFQSTAEMVRAMSDPRYKTDPAYRAEVERKVFNATF